jgi:RNA polymerase sigma-70 factor (ECF subfamily)
MTDWQSIVEEHRELVWRNVYRLLGNHADAEDCFQETFISALKIARQEQIRNWPAILRRLATSRALDRLRQRMRQAGRSETLTEGHVVTSNEPPPNQDAQTQELNAQLRWALIQLPQDQAQVFTLRFMEDLSYREIARQIGIKTSTVGVLLHRARARMKELLESTLTQNKV